MNKREASKQNTRNRVLEAARALFSDPGYEKTTVKMIAEKAECATGSVFTTFVSKEAILTAIIADNYEAASTAFRNGAAAAQGQGVAEELKAALAEGFRLDYPRRNLVVHQIAASWTWSIDFDERTRTSIQGAFGVIGDVIRAAVERGELRNDIDTNLLADQVLGMYLRCFRHDRFYDLGVEGMIQRANAHIDLMLNGALAHTNAAAKRRAS